ncbi:MAG: tRNA pseudouridine(55) synthase TruB [Nannocystales bacterium]
MGKRKRSADEPLGVLYIDKPAGPTSAEVCDFVRWVLRTRSVGHCGTLDPGATGLLVCCVGPATKLVSMLTDDDKTYRGRFVLGRSTTTADAAGEVTAEAELDDSTWARAPEVLRGLLGTHQLAPPAFSAVRIDGERAHEKARRGEAFDVPKRAMTVLSISDVEVVARGEIAATVRVSKGSFIRSLAVELGERLGIPAHLGSLHRIASGSCSLEHPRAISGFDVTAMEPRPDGKPRHRVRVRGVGGEREQQAKALLDALNDPVEVLGVPVFDVPQGAHGEDIVRRVGFGQAIPADHPLLRDHTPVGPLAVRAGPGIVLCRFEPSQAGPVLRVQRTLRALAFDSPAAP